MESPSEISGGGCATWHIPETENSLGPGPLTLEPGLRACDGFENPNCPRPSEPSEIVFCPRTLYRRTRKVLLHKFSPRGLTAGELELLGFKAELLTHAELCELCQLEELVLRLDRGDPEAGR